MGVAKGAPIASSPVFGVPSSVATGWRARIVTYGTVAVMALAVVFQVEAWPVTSFRLFSNVRTDTRSQLQLYVIASDGTRTLVHLRPDQSNVVKTSHQLRDVQAAPPPRQREMVEAWIIGGGLDPADGRLAVIERVRTRITRDGTPPTELSRSVVVEVPLR